MAGYKVHAAVEVRNCTIMIDPTENKTGEVNFGGVGMKVEKESKVILSFEMHNDPQVNRSILLNDQDVDNLFAAIREVQRLRDGQSNNKES